jgi:drug/metabolite transporter (DMT)-like permease
VPARSPAVFAKQPALVWAALLTVYVLWGSTYLGIRIAVETIPPFLMAGARFMVAGAVLLAWRLPAAYRSRTLPTAIQWRRALVIGAALLMGGNGLVCWAEQTVPSGETALIVAVVPIWMALIDRAVYGRRLSAFAVAGLVVGFGGVAMLVWAPGGGPVSWIGALALVAASLSWAAGSLYSRGAAMPADSALGTGMQMLLGGTCLAVVAAFAGEPARLHLAAISPASWAAFSYLVVFGGIVGFSAYLWLLRNAPTGLVSTYAYVNPMVAVFLGWAVLAEPLGIRTLVAAALIVVSVALIVSSRSPASVAAPGHVKETA